MIVLDNVDLMTINTPWRNEVR